MRYRLLLTLFLASCTRTETVTRVVNLHVTAACKIPLPSFGDYVATGDFEPATGPSQQPLATDQAGQTIEGVPANVQSLALLAEASSSAWLGVTLVPPSGDLDMLLLPASSACALNTSADFVNDMVFAAVSSRTMFALGKKPNSSYRIDLGTGKLAHMAVGIGTQRVRAATAALGDGRALVIGGVGLSSPVFERSVEIFDEAVGDFAVTTFFLQEERADHGAVTLANGDVFVAGGQNLSGFVTATERITFDGTLWRTTESSTWPLTQKRIHPYVIRLADGSVLVGGGLDDQNMPVKLVEIFSSDGTSELANSPNVPATGTNAFVALDAGGALFVDAAAPQHAWFIDKNGSQPITPDVTAPLTDVKLFPHAGGGALLWTGSNWLAFDPWTGFSPIGTAPTTGPDASSPIASSDPGLRAWIAPDGTVSVWRDSVRNAFATEGPYLVTADTSLMSPDHLPTPVFDASGLTLDAQTSAFVADARYRDVAVDVDGDAHVVIRGPASEVEVGGPNCPVVSSSQVPPHLHVERIGAVVSFSQGGPLTPCAFIASDARVAVGVRGASAVSHARNLSVVRRNAAEP